MPFPETKRVVYNKPPLTKVICQLRYPPILRIDSEIPSQFQEGIRAEYPLYNERTESQPEIAAGLTAQFPQEVITQLTRSRPAKNHEFCSGDGAWRINLTRTFLSISTSAYRHWEEFIERFNGPFSKLLETYNPPFSTRLGLRYVDIFRRSGLGLEKAKWTDLIQPYFLGLLSSQVGKEVKSYESVYEIGLSDNESSVRIAASLVRDIRTGEECYMVDSDFYRPKRTLPEEAFGKLEFLHSRATRLIQWIIKDDLHRAMEPREI
jgi:uncharacterized protein (TIGR04255 family)